VPIGLLSGSLFSDSIECVVLSIKGSSSPESLLTLVVSASLNITLSFTSIPDYDLCTT
jgi:hypothetical protein